MHTKILVFFLIIFPLGATNTDDEIIKNLDFFQNMDILKDEMALAGSSFSNPKENKIETQNEEIKSQAPEKK